MNDLKITLIQSNLFWENCDKNLEQFSKKISSVTEQTDLIILPEMFTTGFSMLPEKLAESMTGKTVNWMKEQAHKKQCVITGSFICEENGKYYNRLVWMKPDGTYSTYDKRHLFSMANEDKHYTSGNKKIIEEIKGWKICPLICYDLRFPIWSRNRNIPHLPHNSTRPPSLAHYQSHKGDMLPAYDLLIYVANWPARRSFPWKTLLLARAIENQCYVIGENRVGTDGNGIDYSGDSVVIDFKGEILSKTPPHEEFTETISLSYSGLEEFRKQFPVLDDADSFEIL
ncbi:MAG: amidohydrolase [Bacteroidetes bacterium RIFCSPLOWO2_12_FULL_35_15]|nr:MAG: amidohydrolase [Bacteroidetes bacterium RIFCSPLOWO2_12_FULL_35_15]